MPVSIIIFFEIVDVEHQHRQRAAVALAPRRRLCELVAEMAPVGEVRQRIALGQLLELVAQREVVAEEQRDQPHRDPHQQRQRDPYVQQGLADAREDFAV
ncbi:hypothetical protein D3C81_1069070 [compost metagenome]